jgi:hypothetical protein
MRSNNNNKQKKRMKNRNIQHAYFQNQRRKWYRKPPFHFAAASTLTYCDRRSCMYTYRIKRTYTPFCPNNVRDGQLYMCGTNLPRSMNRVPSACIYDIRVTDQTNKDTSRQSLVQAPACMHSPALISVRFPPAPTPTRARGHGSVYT